MYIYIYIYIYIYVLNERNCYFSCKRYLDILNTDCQIQSRENVKDFVKSKSQMTEMCPEAYFGAVLPEIMIE